MRILHTRAKCVLRDTHALTLAVRAASSTFCSCGPVVGAGEPAFRSAFLGVSKCTSRAALSSLRAGLVSACAHQSVVCYRRPWHLREAESSGGWQAEQMAV